MKLKPYLTLLSVLLCMAVGFAQTNVAGSITGEDGAPIPGATIIVQGTNNGTTSDFDGNFSIVVAQNQNLEISYVGYASQVIQYTGQDSISVVLQEDLSELDEIVVIGYGTRKKSHLTGAIAKVGGGEVAAVQANRVDDALAGKLSGVLIQNQSGEPGADPKIQIRAASSLSGDSGPLIVVDGYPISGNLATVNPNDIESLEVLKDAASAAIYGSRGANGVILVTTKKGKSGKLNFSYNSFYSTSKKYVDDIEMLKTAGEFASDLQTSAYNLSQVDPQLADYRINAFANAPDVISVEDWLFKNGSTQSHDLSVSGGSDNTKFFASVGALSTDGVAQTQGFERYNARINVDTNLNDKLKAGISLNGFYSHQDILAWDQRDLLRAYSISPIYHTEASIAFVQQLDAQRQALADGGLTIANLGRTFDRDRRGIGLDPVSISLLQPGDYVHDWHYGRNQNGIGGTGDAGVAAKLDNSDRWVKTYFGNMNSYLQYNIIDGLDIKTVFGTDIRDREQYYYRGILSDGRQRSTATNLDILATKVSTILSETTLSYAKVIDKHDISAVAGLEFQNTYRKGTFTEGNNVPFGFPLNHELFAAADVLVTQIDETISRRSVFGRINYAYDDKYLASFSLREDGDSRFGENQQYATFPALSLGWNAHNEAFLRDNEVLSQLKLRFSTGSLGTTSFLGAYDALSILEIGQTNLGTGFLIPQNIANPDLTWQTNTETNYGIDLGIKNNRFRFSVDYYSSNVEDMLINQSISEVFGTPQIILNRGDVTSSGLEFELNANLISSDNFSWSIGANLSTVETEITSLGDLDELPRQVYGGPSGRGPQFRNYVGGEIGEMWGYEVVREVESVHLGDPTRAVGNSSGYWYVVDQNGDGDISVEEDYVKLGSANPDFYWGLNSNMNFKDFDLSLQFQGSQGAEVYNIDPIYWQTQFGRGLQPDFDANDDGIADANGLHYEQTRNAHGSGIQDASYLALRNLTVGYTMQPEWLENTGIGSLRAYLAATNLLYIIGDNYTSFNPEGVETTNSNYGGPTTYGYQEGASPIVRSFTFGLNVNF